MVISRRQFLAGASAIGLASTASCYRDPPEQIFSGAKDSEGYAVYGIQSSNLQNMFRLRVRQRVHGFARRPYSREVVVFSRRPGEFAIVFDQETGEQITQINSQKGRHFYGHGVFSNNGNRLYATENAYETGIGVLGIYDPGNSYRRVGEFESGGIGPHEVKILDDSHTLAVANGGVKTHPDTGRTKLNLDTMESSICYVNAETGLLQHADRISPKGEGISVRHIAVSPKNEVIFAAQSYGRPGNYPPLIGRSSIEKPHRFLTMNDHFLKSLNNYCGSIVMSGDGKKIAVSAPRGNKCLQLNLNDMSWRAFDLADGCGLIYDQRDVLLASNGKGEFIHYKQNPQINVDVYTRRDHSLQWDNHIG